jgi:hypothetical protein
MRDTSSQAHSTTSWRIAGKVAQSAPRRPPSTSHISPGKGEVSRISTTEPNIFSVSFRPCPFCWTEVSFRSHCSPVRSVSRSVRRWSAIVLSRRDQPSRQQDASSPRVLEQIVVVILSAGREGEAYPPAHPMTRRENLQKIAAHTSHMPYISLCRKEMSSAWEGATSLQLASRRTPRPAHARIVLQ